MYDDLTVIVCCAGMGKRLGIDYPKSLLNVDGKPLIIRLLEAFNSVKDVRIVVGFKYNELIKIVNAFRKDVLFCFNRDYARNGPAVSLKKAFKGVRNRVLIIDGDVVIKTSTLKSILPLNDIILANLSNKEDGMRIVTDENKKAISFSKNPGELTYAGIVLIDKNRVSFNDNSKYIYECLNLRGGLDLKIVDSIDVNSPIDYTYAINLVKNNFKETLVIGCLGGMGTYATINLFNLYAEIFTAKLENERPRIIIDNNCTMPSRVRAFLYNERRDELIHAMANSLSNLIASGANKLILACNTSHLFLEDIYKIRPELKDYIINIIDVTAIFLKNHNIRCVYLLASEATIDSKIFVKTFSKYDIEVKYPPENDYAAIRTCIEAAKRNQYSPKVKEIFLMLLNADLPYILGCTELPILYKKYKEFLPGNKIIVDPLEVSLRFIKENYF